MAASRRGDRAQGAPLPGSMRARDGDRDEGGGAREGSEQGDREKGLLGLSWERLGQDANGLSWLLGCKAAGLLLSLYSFIFQNRKYQRGKEEERKCLG